MAKKKKKRPGIDSKDKGNRGERAALKLLEKWWGSPFVKTPQSGGFSTKRFRQNWNAEADVVTTDPTFPFSVEVKWQEEWTLDMLLTAPKTKIWEWWEQAKGQSDTKLTSLVFKKNRKPFFIMMRIQDEHSVYQKNFIEESPIRIIDRQGKFAYIRLFSDLLVEPTEKWAKSLKNSC